MKSDDRQYNLILMSNVFSDLKRANKVPTSKLRAAFIGRLVFVNKLLLLMQLNYPLTTTTI